MKRILITILTVCLITIFPVTAYSANNMYWATVLTGGAAGALDAIDGALLVDLDGAVVATDGTSYFYSLDATSAAGESSPDIISPDSNAGDKRWILQEIRAESITLTDTVDAVTFTGTSSTMTGAAQSADLTVTNRAWIPDDKKLIFGTNEDISIEYDEDGDDELKITGKVDFEDGIYESGGVLKENLLTNSGFGVWSNSTLEDVRNLPDATTTVAGVTCTSTDHLLSAGMLVTDDTDAVFEVVSIGGASTFDVDRAGASSGTQWQEVTPGCVAADALGPDGWAKTSTLDIWKQHDDATYTKDGSFYSVKTKKGANSAENIVSFSVNDMHINTEHVRKFAGRTVTKGVWVYSVSAADNARLGISDNLGTSFSGYATADGWVWLEVTRTFSSAITNMRTFLACDGDTNDVAYFSQPILVFGSSIGEGNYSSPPGEIINLEAPITLTDYDNDALGAIDANQNLEAQSSGKIGKGAKAMHIELWGTNSAASKYISVSEDTDDNGGIRLQSQVGAVKNSLAGRINLDSNGDFWLNDGADTNWTAVYLKVNAIELR